jgi:hypothetical protein
MIDFLKNFFAGEKSPEEKMLAAHAAAPQKKHDVLSLDAYAMAEKSPEDEDDFCAPSGGCCGGGCRS